uniref:Uncharacterized protein n=1 Tax=Anguilla anguilla TaxID=7936 RepID=A0A0E9WHC6_ANGAN
MYTLMSDPPTSQVRPTLIKHQRLHLIAAVQADGFEIFQFSKIPQLQGVILSTCGQVVAVLGEGDGGDGARVAGEVGHVGALLQVPDLNLRIGRARPKNEPVRVEFGRRSEHS